MNLQTSIPFSKQSHNQIDYNSEILLLGSCFSENIGGKFEYFKFNTSINPFGILFHPFAIEKLITNAVNEYRYKEEDVFKLNDQWHCFDAHSRLSSPSKEVILKTINSAIHSTLQQLRNATHIIITLGTAWVYRNIETDNIVASCHKAPQKKFLKEILTVEEVTESLDAIVSMIRTINTNCTVIFTVSPVRHLKDGFIENTQSKAHLLCAVHQVVEPRHNLFYFPSYEIMMDELRDYRFYNADMLHPSLTAIQYIWNKFCNQWLSENAQQLMLEVDSIQKDLAHKPFDESSENHQKFLQKLKIKQENLSKKSSNIQF